MYFCGLFWVWCVRFAHLLKLLSARFAVSFTKLHNLRFSNLKCGIKNIAGIKNCICLYLLQYISAWKWFIKSTGTKINTLDRFTALRSNQLYLRDRQRSLYRTFGKLKVSARIEKANFQRLSLQITPWGNRTN